MPSCRAVRLAVLLAGSVLLVPASEAASVTADGGGFSSEDGNVTKHPFNVTHVDDTATDGSKSVTGDGFSERATLTDPPIVSMRASGAGSASAAPGRLRAVAVSHAFVRGIVPLYSPRASANFGASFSDAIHLNSVGLAAGTPVTYRGRIEISAEQSGAYYYSGFGYPTGTFYFSYAIGGYGTTYHFPVSGFSDLPDLHFQIPFEFTGEVGDVVTVTGTLGVGTESRANDGYGDDQQTTLDASNGVTFYIEPATPGVTISSDSGHDYSVPEPGPGLLGTMGMLSVLGLAARRRRRTKRSTCFSA